MLGLLLGAVLTLGTSGPVKPGEPRQRAIIAHNFRVITSRYPNTMPIGTEIALPPGTRARFYQVRRARVDCCGMGSSPVFRELELGAMRAHILHHASQAPLFGSWMLEELRRHGYDLSYGTLYPALHKMEYEGLLSRENRVEGGRVRKYYSATEEGVRELERVKGMIRELYGEVVGGEGPAPPKET
jgi:PadR family transcriptional regulator, regulatory protein PadR